MPKLAITVSREMKKEILRVVREYRVFYSSVSDLGRTALRNEILRVRQAEAKGRRGGR